MAVSAFQCTKSCHCGVLIVRCLLSDWVHTGFRNSILSYRVRYMLIPDFVFVPQICYVCSDSASLSEYNFYCVEIMVN